jgi:hypothetical protein
MAKTKKRASEGICKLTNDRGKFVKAHLIPKALTRPAIAGAPFVETGLGRPPSRKWSSWYDHQIVIQKGEDHLSTIDTHGIAELRRHKLVWSGWGPMMTIPTESIGDTGWGIRRLVDIDGKQLRLFFISLVWRAAISNLPGFADVTLEEHDVERLRKIVLSGDTEPPEYFAITLTQISTLAEMHNLTPFHRTKTLRDRDGTVIKEVPFIRFYFEGLIAHVHPSEGESDDWGPMLVGSGNELVVSTVTYERSFQKENMDNLASEALRDWPQRMIRL